VFDRDAIAARGVASPAAANVENTLIFLGKMCFFFLRH
jgi:hypothetical protein